MLMIGLGGDPNKIEHDGYYEDTYVKTAQGWRFKQRMHHVRLGVAPPAQTAAPAAAPGGHPQPAHSVDRRGRTRAVGPEPGARSPEPGARSPEPGKFYLSSGRPSRRHVEKWPSRNATRVKPRRRNARPAIRARGPCPQ